MGKYTDYIMKTAQDLLSVPSPSGFTHMAADFVKKEFEKLGYEPQITQKGAVLVKGTKVFLELGRKKMDLY